MTTDKLIRVIMALVVAYLLFHLGRFASDFVAHGLFHVPPHVHRWLSLGFGIGAVLLLWEPTYQKLLAVLAQDLTVTLPDDSSVTCV